MTLYDFVWLFMTMTIHDYALLCMTLYNSIWLNMYEYVRLLMNMYDYEYVCQCMTMGHFVWLYMPIYDLWLCMTMYDSIITLYDYVLYA